MTGEPKKSKQSPFLLEQTALGSWVSCAAAISKPNGAH